MKRISTPGNDRYRGSVLMDAIVAIFIISAAFVALLTAMRNLSQAGTAIFSSLEREAAVVSTRYLLPDGSMQDAGE